MNPFTIFAMLQASKPANLSAFGIGAAVGVFLVGLVVLFLARRYFRARDARKEEPSQTPRTQNPSAFMAASMQGVIQKLRDQEKELERLHRRPKLLASFIRQAEIPIRLRL